MKKYISSAIVALSLTLLCPTSTFAQWDYGQDSIWNGIEARMDIRRTRERMRARRGKGRKSSARTARSRRGKRSASSRVARRAAAPAKRAVAPLPRYGVEFFRDTYQDFHREDINGFRVNFSFVSATTGKTISKSGVCPLYDAGNAIEGIPAGTYTVRAEAVYKGKKYPAHVGSQEGSDDDPKGGDFAPSMKVVLKPIIDDGGSRVMGITPGKLYIRVLE